MASKALDKSGKSTANPSGNADWRDVVRAAADKVTGDTRPAGAQAVSPAQPAGQPAPAPVRASAPQRPLNPEDSSAIARYDYLLKTAQPEQLEQVHRDAFARLTPAQRDQVNAQLRAELPANEHPASAQPADLARAAARGEAHKPGFLRGLFAKSNGRGGAGALAGAGVGAVAGVGLGAAGGLLAAVAGGAVLSSVAAPILEQAAGLGVDFENLAGGVGDLTAGAEDYAGGLGEQLTDLGSNVEAPALGDLASNFEIPGLGDLGRLFGRDS
ncbi:cation-transporting ATPase [Cryobacterium sp. AP23]